MSSFQPHAQYGYPPHPLLHNPAIPTFRSTAPLKVQTGIYSKYPRPIHLVPRPPRPEPQTPMPKWTSGEKFKDLPAEIYIMITECPGITWEDKLSLRLVHPNMRYNMCPVVFRQVYMRFGKKIMREHFLDEHGRPIKVRRDQKNAKNRPINWEMRDKLEEYVLKRNISKKGLSFLSACKILNLSILDRYSGFDKSLATKTTIKRIKRNMPGLATLNLHVNVGQQGVKATEAIPFVTEFCKIGDEITINITLSGINEDARMLAAVRNVTTVRFFAGNVIRNDSVMDSIAGIIVNNPKLSSLHISWKNFSIAKLLEKLEALEFESISLKRLRLDHCDPNMPGLQEFKSLDSLELNCLKSDTMADKRHTDDTWDELLKNKIYLASINVWIELNRPFLRYIEVSTRLKHLSIRPLFTASAPGLGHGHDLSQKFWKEVLPQLANTLESLGVDLVGHSTDSTYRPNYAVARQWCITNASGNLPFNHLKMMTCLLLFSGYQAYDCQFSSFIGVISAAPKLCKVDLTVYEDQRVFMIPPPNTLADRTLTCVQNYQSNATLSCPADSTYLRVQVAAAGEQVKIPGPQLFRLDGTTTSLPDHRFNRGIGMWLDVNKERENAVLRWKQREEEERKKQREHRTWEVFFRKVGAQRQQQRSLQRIALQRAAQQNTVQQPGQVMQGPHTYLDPMLHSHQYTPNNLN